MIAPDVKTVRLLDRLTIEGGTPGLTLMERAAKGLVEAALEMTAELKRPARILVLCGKGNNGGDGLLAAVGLKNAGAKVTCFLALGGETLQHDTRTALSRVRKASLACLDGRQAPLPAWHQFDLILDALFGTGFTLPLTESIRKLTRAVNLSGIPVLSADVPTGVDADTGAADSDALFADLTVTFGLPKRGLFFFPARTHVGDLRVQEIGLNLDPLRSLSRPLHVIDRTLAAGRLPKRAEDAHKKSCGRVLVVAGSKGMTGAAVLTAHAALKSGAGIVTLATPESLNTIFEIKLTEEMTLPLPDAGKGRFTASHTQPLLNALAEYDVLAIGPGLSRHPDVFKMVRELVLKSPVPVILDADGINAFEGKAALLKKAKSSVVITPHEGEFRRLTGEKEMGQGPTRINTLLNWQNKLSVAVVLKGAPTLIAFSPDYACVNTTGNPGMATAGAGDVLTGLIAGLFAQSGDLEGAAISGVFLHGLSGDAAVVEQTDYVVSALDLIRYLPHAFKEIER
ncbi:MAG: hypothetical protein A2293_12205 [Elusimicrobia bacterium RIFOXYB2_FULL_49_7]|nr:MAG: hypothetical protein A2293_12205 [Elusimicrobia bacterium RIFOXYB2_FULL_49_7]